MRNGVSTYAPTSTASRMASSNSLLASSKRLRAMAVSPPALLTWASIQRSPVRRATVRSSARVSSTPSIPPGLSTATWTPNSRAAPISQSPPCSRQLASDLSMSSRMPSVLPRTNAISGQMMPGNRAASGPPRAMEVRTPLAYSCVRSSFSGTWPSSALRKRSSTRSLIRGRCKG